LPQVLRDKETHESQREIPDVHAVCPAHGTLRPECGARPVCKVGGEKRKFQTGALTCEKAFPTCGSGMPVAGSQVVNARRFLRSEMCLAVAGAMHVQCMGTRAV
jgi:hypothetical protein